MANTPEYKVILFNNQRITINPKQRLISVNILECYDIAVFEIGYTYGQKAFVMVDEQTYVKEKYLRAFCEEIGRKYIDVFNLRTNIETMSSLQIAQLTGKRHDNVMADIKNMLEQLNIQSPEFLGDYKDSRGRTYPCYNLNEELTLTLTSGYSIPQRNAIIKEWQAYRNGQLIETTPAPLESSQYEGALKILGVPEQVVSAIAKVYEERDEAIRTKSQIGSKREATAMATAGVMTKRVIELEAKLGIVKDRAIRFATVLAIESRIMSFKANGRKLANYCRKMGLKFNEVPDTRFGKVNSYPAEAWQGVYNIDINRILGV